MVKMTLIAHVTDGLPLAEGLVDGLDLRDAEMYKQQVKDLFKNLLKGHNEASWMSVETESYVFRSIFYDLKLDGAVDLQIFLKKCEERLKKRIWDGVNFIAPSLVHWK
ncbi:hypothetical protein Dsin_017553 [Dipteronia sinensis]|uniref:Uncharacterized protein n=1 Tax=Dipteronia sinensis TaxID=43782 RepID=A0AAE0AGG3_9ROSI|nr:hypothetical protein Dsin_017553 [Dipteronia sinensis]